MIIYYVFFFLSPFSSFIFLRNFLPILWCLNYLFNNGVSDKYSDIVVFHMIYLLIQMLFILLFMVFVINKIKTSKKNNLEIINKKKLTKVSYILIILVIFYFIFNMGKIPILMDQGSDSIHYLVESNKLETWLIYGILSIVQYVFLIVIINMHKYKKNYIFKFIILIFFFAIALVSGKKSVLMSLLFSFLFIYYLYNKKASKKIIFSSIFLFLLGFIYIFIQFTRTTSGNIDFFNIYNLIFSFWNIIWNHSTVYLQQIINSGGIDFIKDYSNNLGLKGKFLYFLNPYTKLLFGIGIERSIGPYLSYTLYGDNFPHGVNPTLFFEFCYIFGYKIAGLFSLFFLPIIYFIQKYFFLKSI